VRGRLERNATLGGKRKISLAVICTIVGLLSWPQGCDREFGMLAERR